MSSFEVLVNATVTKLCLECVNPGGFHDPFTQWQLPQGNGTVTLSNNDTLGDLEVLQGFLTVINPYSRLKNNNFFTLCTGFEISYIVLIYSTGTDSSVTIL